MKTELTKKANKLINDKVNAGSISDTAAYYLRQGAEWAITNKELLAAQYLNENTNCVCHTDLVCSLHCENITSQS